MTEPSASGVPAPLPRRAMAVLFAITAVACALRVFMVGSQPLLGDDVFVGQTARNFVELGWREPTMWNHPRLRDLLVYLSLRLLGDGPWGVRAWSVLLGTLAVPLTAFLTLRLTSSLLAAAFAGLIVALDPLHVDFSRQGINDVYLSAISIAAILALLRYRDRGEPAWLALAGLLTGLGAASKWNVLFPVATAAVPVLWARARAATSPRAAAVEAALFVASMVLVPLGVYVLTFWPWFGRGHGVGEFLRLQAAMAIETSTHTGYPGTKLPGFPGEVVGAWRWFLQPIWFVDHIPPMAGRPGYEAGFVLPAVANPAVWLSVLPSAAAAAWRWRRTRETGPAWLLALFLAAYLPFALVPRPIWTNSAVSVLPFAAALVGWGAAQLHARRPAVVRAWGAAVLVLAALLIPPAIGIASRPSDALVEAIVAPEALTLSQEPAR